jgi:uncharacterized membrane protein YfhO
VGTVDVVERRADRVRLRAALQREAYVVLLEGHARGWRVTVDGAPQPLLQANLAFRAVRVAAGTHDVVFAYRPRGAMVGVVVSALALAAAVVLGRRR